MPLPKWLVVARNEYRIRTSRIRKIRPFFPYLVIGLLAVYIGFFTPAIVSLFIGDFLASLPPYALVPMMQIILFMVFFYFIIIPITYTLREEQAGQLEIFLAAPIKPSDILLGEFLGVMPIYAIAITLITGLFTAVARVHMGLDLVQIAIIIIIFIVTFFSALWIGTVIAAILRTRLGKTARGKDIGRALALVIALPMVAVMYAIMGGGLLQALADPATSGMVRVILGLLPSSWGAEVFGDFALAPGNIGAVGLLTLARFGGLVAFFVVALWLGAKVADRAYSLEAVSFASSRAKPDGVFYKTVRSLGGGGSFGTLLVSVFKDYSRRLENLSKIFYMVGILVLVNIFFGRPDDPEGALLMPQLILPLLAAFVVGEVTLRGKEALFIYKKTPSGVGRLVKARLLHGWLVV
ncbi:MAG: ABC transporter permease, partial [Candidatus Bathyarchaeota archaeon]